MLGLPSQRLKRRMKKAFVSFNKSLGDPNVLNDVSRIADLLEVHNFTSGAF